MKNKFDFYGIKVPGRKKITRVFLVKKHLTPKNDLEKIVKIL